MRRERITKMATGAICCTMCASSASNADAADYLRWRIEHAGCFGFEQKREDNNFEWPPQKPHVSGTIIANELEKRAADAPEPLKPQWLYLRGALGFHAGERVECAQWFERVWKEFPNHPRAEAALFLSARCALAQFIRSNPLDGLEIEELNSEGRKNAMEKGDQRMRELRENASALFKKYLEKYPKGRFLADVYGWLGALDFRAGDNAAALTDYIYQIETPGHPEVVKSALFMCEKVLSEAKAGDDALFAIAAQHPVVAMGATYLVLNTAEAPMSDADAQQFNAMETTGAQQNYESAQTKKWRQIVLPKLAAQVSAHKDLYKPDDWPARDLAILAQAASAAGNQQQALDLTAIPTAQLDGSDDLLLARGVAFQRVGNAKEAIATYRNLLEKFSKSQLARGTQLKLALALQDSHEAGRALVELKRLCDAISNGELASYEPSDTVYPPGDASLKMTDSAVLPDISDAESAQIDQIIDALCNFAPLPELATVLRDASVDDAFQNQISAVLAERSLTHENFADAKKFRGGVQPDPVAANLEKLSGEAAAAKTPEQKAQAMAELGNAWADARGKLLKLPLESGSATQAIFFDDDEQAALRRRENGRALGFKNTDDELEERDEMRHASRWWMRTARALPGTPLAATARWKALDAMPRIASASDYAFLRAVEIKSAVVSRELYEKLRSECPDSIEAKKYAVYWSFPMPTRKPGETDFIKFNDHNERERDAIGEMGYMQFDDGAFGVTRNFEDLEMNEPHGTLKDWEKIRAQILALHEHSAEWDTARFAAEVDALRNEVKALHPPLENARYLNLLDDFALFLQEQNLTPEIRRAYIELRLRYNGFLKPNESGNAGSYEEAGRVEALQKQHIEELLADPVLKPVADYVDFIKAVQSLESRRDQSETNEVSQNETPLKSSADYYASLEGAMREFLAKYPHSRKREAARLLLARAVHWLTTPLVAMWNPKDDEPDPEKAARMDAPSVVKIEWREKFDAKRVREPLDEYDREFPNGRYAADIRDYRGSAAWRTRDWAAALDATMTNLDDAAHPDLQPEAALRLANIFGDLADAENRGDLLNAIRQRPKAVEHLQQYLTATWRYKDHPLRYLGEYLADQLGFEYKEPPAPTVQ